MFNKERYNWEKDDTIGQQLSSEVDHVISRAEHEVSIVEYECKSKIVENKMRLESMQYRIGQL